MVGNFFLESTIRVSEPLWGWALKSVRTASVSLATIPVVMGRERYAAGGQSIDFPHPDFSSYHTVVHLNSFTAQAGTGGRNRVVSGSHRTRWFRMISSVSLSRS